MSTRPVGNCNYLKKQGRNYALCKFGQGLTHAHTQRQTERER